MRLSECIGPAFSAIHKAIRYGHDAGGVPKTHFWLKGGRGSLKSSFAAVELILSLKRDSKLNAVVMRKVGNTMRDSVYAQLLWAIEKLGVSHEFHARLTPMEIIYKPTGQRILFRGADKPEKLKSLKVKRGYIGLVWFEELDQYAGMREVRNILQSLMRGGETFRVLYSYNPPRSRDSWVNRESLTVRDDRMTHESSYLDAPREWLGETFFHEAEELLAVNETAYNHEYLGDVTGTGGQVFENIKTRAITADEIQSFDRVYCGVDWGYFPDPFIFARMHYDKKHRTLYIFEEITANRAGNTATAELVRAALTYADVPGGEARYHHDIVICDSSEPKSIDDYVKAGINARGAKKGPGSVDHGMKWLQDLVAIVIDPKRCPRAADEFTRYEYEQTRDGEYCSVYPDRDNHAVDLSRYACEPLMRGGRVEVFR